MITCTLNGRLGNQMFQIAATIATALKHKVPYSIPSKTLNDCFPVYFDHFPFQTHSGKMFTWHEKNPQYEEIKYPGRNLLLNGYFQSYKYFQEYNQEIINAFDLGIALTHPPMVSIHVRRGDYLTNPDFTVLNLQYYLASINFFIKNGHTNFCVFSDDMEWCKENINSAWYPECKFWYQQGNAPKVDLNIMASCQHHIIANSSFSWWGAWLSKNPDKIVIAPDTWFKNVNKDMLPAEWLIFKNE